MDLHAQTGVALVNRGPRRGFIDTCLQDSPLHSHENEISDHYLRTPTLALHAHVKWSGWHMSAHSQATRAQPPSHAGTLRGLFCDRVSMLHRRPAKTCLWNSRNARNRCLGCIQTRPMVPTGTQGPAVYSLKHILDTYRRHWLDVAT